MAPIITFLKIHQNVTIKLRIMINLQTSPLTTTESSLTLQNNTRLIKLTRTRKVVLSNSQITDLLNVFKAELCRLLIEDSVDFLKSRSEKNRNRREKDGLSFVLGSSGWKIRVLFSVGWIEGLRTGMGSFTDLVVRVPKDGSLETDENGKGEEQVLLEEEEETRIPEEGEIVLIDDEGEQEDEKFVQKFDFKRHRVYERPLQIEVLQARRI